MRRGILICAALVTTSCAVTQLTQEGEDVEVGGTAGPDCKFLSTVSAYEGNNGQSAETNMVAAQAQLRNQAAEVGANHIVITSQQLGREGGGSLLWPAVKGSTQDSGCGNCISMVASAYYCGARLSGVPYASVARGSAAASANTQKGQFPRAEAKAALDAAWTGAKSCKAAESPVGPVTMKVTFAPGGDPIFIDIAEQEIANSATGECILRKFRGVRLPAFDGESISVSRSFVLEK